MAYKERGVIGMVWGDSSLRWPDGYCASTRKWHVLESHKMSSLGEMNHNFSTRKVETGYWGLLTRQFSLTRELQISERPFLKEDGWYYWGWHLRLLLPLTCMCTHVCAHPDTHTNMYTCLHQSQKERRHKTCACENDTFYFLLSMGGAKQLVNKAAGHRIILCDEFSLLVMMKLYCVLTASLDMDMDSISQ